jgi:hypothetical protein
MICNYVNQKKERMKAVTVTATTKFFFKAIYQVDLIN